MKDQNKPEGWSDEELIASCLAYELLRVQSKAGEKINKARTYRILSASYGRSPKSYEFRFQNISFIYEKLGKKHLKGLLPAKNIGKNIETKLKKFVQDAIATIKTSKSLEEIVLKSNVKGE